MRTFTSNSSRRIVAGGLAAALCAGLAFAWFDIPGGGGGGAAAMGDAPSTTVTTVAAPKTFPVTVQVRDENLKAVDGAKLTLYNSAYNEVVGVAINKTTVESGPDWSNWTFNVLPGEYYLADTPPAPYKPVSDSDGDNTKLGGSCTDGKSCIRFEVNAAGKIRLLGQTLDAQRLVFTVAKPATTPVNNTEPTSEIITVHVVDHAGQPIAGATVTFVNASGGNPRSAVTEGDGTVRALVNHGVAYRIEQTPPAHYAVDGNSLGTEPANTVVVTANGDTGVTFVDGEGLPLPVVPKPNTTPATIAPTTTSTSTTSTTWPRYNTTTTTFREVQLPPNKG